MHGGGRRGYACKYASTAAASSKSLAMATLAMATMTSTSSLCTLVTPNEAYEMHQINFNLTNQKKKL